jgi:hypothetical protein
MRVFPRTLGITALLLAPALHTAMAQEPAPAVTEPPPAPPAAPAAAPASAPMNAETGAFGSQGQIAISVDVGFLNDGSQLSIAHGSASQNGGSATVIALRPSADYFVAPHVSLGGQIGILHDSANANIAGSPFSSSGTEFDVEIRGGYELELADSLSLWPRLGIGYSHTSGNGNPSGYGIDLRVSVPVLWHPVSHFFLGVAPALRTDLVSKQGGMDQSKETNFGLSGLIGGYFGGA